MKKYTSISIVLIAAFVGLTLAACTGPSAGTSAAATASPTALPLADAAVSPTVALSTTAESTVSFPLVDSNLLDAPTAQIECDHPDEATMTCAGTPHLTEIAVDVAASTYARWRLRWEDAPTTGDPLTGVETLHLRTTSTGDLHPNLYLVQADGTRTSVNLSRYGLREGSSDVYVPLAEVRGEENSVPDFEQIVEVQLVFEWADMAGELTVQHLGFVSVWREPVAVSDDAVALAASLQLPSGFVAQPLLDNVRSTTQVEFTPGGDALVQLQHGRVWWYTDTDSDGALDQRHLYTAGLEETVGLLYDPSDGSVWLGGRGQLHRTLDEDGNGVADRYELRLDGLPWGRHQNNGLAWNPDPDPFTGEPGGTWIYFGLGSTEDLEVGGEYNATILRFPRDGSGVDDLEVVSRGNRNAYDVVWAPVPAPGAEPGESAPSWQLFASENGPDFNEAPDEVNHIRWQHHYGFPDYFGVYTEDEPLQSDGWPYSGAIYDVLPHASADGLAYVTNEAWPSEYRTLYVSLFGEVFSPDVVGHTVERITLTPAESATGPTYRGEPSDFIVGMDRPLPMTTDPQGNLVVGDYATGVVYRIVYAEPTQE